MSSEKLRACPDCGGDGKEHCNNPDHGFINAVGGELARLGCPVCGGDPDWVGEGVCLTCEGTGTRAEQPPEAATHYPECPHGTDRRVPCENCQKVAETDGENQVIIERLKGEVERLTSDIESGFAKGSYARLRNLQEAEVERDQLRDALIRLRDCDWTITLPDRMDAVRTIARKALAAGEQQGEA
jgi:hypothetical protein